MGWEKQRESGKEQRDHAREMGWIKTNQGVGGTSQGVGGGARSRRLRSELPFEAANQSHPIELG
jgi:hypothetical protein